MRLIPYDTPQASDRKHAILYNSLACDYSHPAVHSSYRILVDHLMEQYKLLCDNGIVFTFTKRETSTSRDLFSAMEKKHPIPVLLTSAAGALPEDHPFLADSGVSYDAHHLCINDIFRAAHDIVGHYVPNATFSPQGEFRSWTAHMTTLPQDAWLALWCETRGQNASTNFSGDVNYRPRRERPFAPQKAGFVPLEDIFGPARERIMRELTRPLVVHSVSPEVDEIFRPERVRHYLNTIG